MDAMTKMTIIIDILRFRAPHLALFEKFHEGIFQRAVSWLLLAIAIA
jgi:hypothetical protein